MLEQTDRSKFFMDSGVNATVTRLGSLETITTDLWGNATIGREELSDYSKSVIVSQGKHGTVYKVVHGVCRGSQVAIKVLRTSNMKPAQIEALQREADIMRSLRNPNILLMMGVCVDDDSLAIVTEYVDGRDLNAIIYDAAVEMSVRQKLNIAKGIAQGVNWLHCLQPTPIIHRDLKPANILVTREGNVKVADFGLSCLREDFDPNGPLKDSVTGTAIYMAPEVLSGVPASEKSDVYAYGILLWELFSRVKPYQEIESVRKLQQAVVDKTVRPPLTSDIPEAVAALIKMCWAHDRDARPTFDEILKLLDDIVIDLILPDAASRTFWRNMRSKHVQHYPWAVSWDGFIESYHTYAKPRLPFKLYELSPEGKCAKLILGHTARDITRSQSAQETIVVLENFGRFCLLFGPFGPSILSAFNELCKTKCFHGMIESKEAERRLAGTKKGFLLRMSAKDASCITISRDDKGKIRHLRVLRTDQGFNVQVGKDLHLFPSLIDFLSSPQATKSGKGLGLKKPCSKDSEFAAVHETPDDDGETDCYDESPLTDAMASARIKP